MTHGHELRGNAGGREQGYWVEGDKREKKWGNCNNIINKIYFKILYKNKIKCLHFKLFLLLHHFFQNRNSLKWLKSKDTYILLNSFLQCEIQSLIKVVTYKKKITRFFTLDIQKVKSRFSHQQHEFRKSTLTPWISISTFNKTEKLYLPFWLVWRYCIHTLRCESAQ